MREHEALSTVFDVTNGGLLPLKDVDIACQMDKLADQSRNRIENVTLSFAGSRIANLGAGVTTSAPCEHTVSGDPTLHGTMGILVSYRPAFWPFRKGEKFLMESEQTDHGTWIWKYRSTTDFDPK